MLEEIRSGARKEGPLSRRWYCGPEFDLYVWRVSTHEIVQFQLSWKRPTKLHDPDTIPEEVLTWSREHGLRQDQRLEASGYRAPILTAGQGVHFDELVAAFAVAAEQSTYPDIRFTLRELQSRAERT